MIIEQYSGPIPQSVFGVFALLAAFVPISGIIYFAIIKGDFLS